MIESEIDAHPHMWFDIIYMYVYPPISTVSMLEKHPFQLRIIKKFFSIWFEIRQDLPKMHVSKIKIFAHPNSPEYLYRMSHRKYACAPILSMVCICKSIFSISTVNLMTYSCRRTCATHRTSNRKIFVFKKKKRFSSYKFKVSDSLVSYEKYIHELIWKFVLFFFWSLAKTAHGMCQWWHW